MSTDHKNGPINKLRENTLSAEIWENVRDQGTQHNVTFSRSYRDQEGNWKSTSSFGPRDLLPLQHLMGRAHDTIRERQAELRREERASERPKGKRSRSRDRERDRDRER